ncbi:MAG: hypothetical protein H0V14_11680, partial [Chitinophagaceae bacterium]|nr:hypothetical protein [Chitinophagaceae bacterium]
MQKTKQYKSIVDIRVAEILSTAEYGSSFIPRIILFINQISQEIIFPVYTLIKGTPAKAIKKISANKIRLDSGTAIRLLIRNKF